MRMPGLRPDAMNRTAPLLAVFVLLVAGVAVPATASVADSMDSADHSAQAGTATPSSNGSDERATPGAQFAGVVDVQEAEVESELEGRAFGIKIARANSNDSKAAVVAEEVDELRLRMETLREHKQSLTEARENGSISQARYRAEIAVLTTKAASVEQQLDLTEATSRDLPADLLESKGVSTTAIETLQNDSRNVAGPETADIARSIAGPVSGDGLDGKNANTGPPGTIPDRAGPPNGSDTPGGPPETGEFHTPTIPGNDNVTGPPTSSGGPDLPNVTDNISDAISPIFGGSGEEGSTETSTSTGTETSTATETSTDTQTETDGNESEGTTTG